MGTDIHLSIEVNVPRYVYLADGEKKYEWQALTFPYVDEFWLDKLEENPDDELAAKYAYRVGELYDGRNYSLFAVLSDVRNGFGFAGITTGDAVIPSPAATRGIPTWSAYGRDREFDMPSGFLHSIGWLRLTEMFDGTVPWDQSEYKTGYFSAGTLSILDPEWLEERQGTPRLREGEDDRGFGWSGQVSGANVVNHESYDEYLAAYADTMFDPTKDHYVKLGWYTSPREQCADFIEAMEWLRDTGLNGIPADKCRIVIGYDS